MKKLLLSVLVLSAASLRAEHIAPDHPAIRIEGAKYTHSVSNGVELLRFPEELLKLGYGQWQADPMRARTTSGAVIIFRTAAPSAKLHFRVATVPPGRDSQFAADVNGKRQKEFYFSKTQPQQMVEVKNPNPGTPATFRIIMPSWSNPVFTGIDLPDGGKLLEMEQPERKVYVALGDSITHGTGQGSATYQTFPFLLAQKLDVELFNLAVGGAKISLPIAQTLKDWKQVDLFTVLIGVNDWTSGKTVDQYRDDLNQLIDTVRKYHPAAKLFMIRPICTKVQTPKTGDATIAQFRDAVSDAVKKRHETGDKNIFLIDGDRLTSEADLIDPYHLNPEGAAKFADSLHKEISKEF